MRLANLRRADGIQAALVADGAAVPVAELADEAPLTGDPAPSVADLLDGWAQARLALADVVDAAGPGHEAAVDLAETDLAAPVPEPPTVRDFYAFEEHVARSWKRRGEEIPGAWYDVPVFYFSNPTSILGPDRPVPRPASTDQLDFELEVAWVMGQRCRDLAPEEAEEAVAGLTVMNDFSARDVQAHEMQVGLGPSKGKDFATGLGPVLVTLDELEDARGEVAFDLGMRAEVNGETVSRGNLDQLHWSIGEMTAHASRDATLRPGDVLGTGTVGTGSVLDLGDDAWLEPGDEIALEVDRLGRLEHRIVEP
jgi:fumarylacetoacetate (FAA) hydrolase